WHERIWYRSTFPVVGRYSCDTALSWPSQREIIEAAYPVDGRFDVRILGETKTAIDLLKVDQPPQGWTIYLEHELSRFDFLRSIDFYVFYPDPMLLQIAWRPILEALASGVVVILPKEFEHVFGDAAVYVEPCDAEKMITYLHSDFRIYKSQLNRSLNVLQDR